MVGMHIVVVGCGRVGSGLAVRLDARGHSVAIIDKAPRSFRRLPPEWPGQKVVGSGFNRDALDAAGASRAQGLAAVTNGDNSNILSARIAREHYGIANVVARIYDPRRAEIYQRLGIPTVPTVSWTIDRVMQRLTPDLEKAEWTDSTGGFALVERFLPSNWAGRPLASLSQKGKFSLIAVTRSGEPRLDTNGLVGQEGDVLYLVVTKGADEALKSLFEAPVVTADKHDKRTART